MEQRLFVTRESRNGIMRKWEDPVEGLFYVVGADCAKGTSGDYSAAIVLEAQSCRIVAALHDRIQPTPFGKKLAALAWMYNSAVLGIETFPAGYGTLACEAAIQAGYRNLYTRVDHKKTAMTMTDDLGWKTDTLTSDRMVGRVGNAVRERYPIVYRELVDELIAQRWEEARPGSTTGPKIHSSMNDDLSDAYAIALCIRDELYQRGTIQTPAPPTMSDDERFWASQKQALDRMSRPRPTFGRGRTQ